MAERATEYIEELASAGYSKSLVSKTMKNVLDEIREIERRERYVTKRREE